MADPFSGSNARRSAVWQANTGGDLLAQLQQIYGPGFQQIIDDIKSGYGTAGKTLDAGIRKEQDTLKDYGAAARSNIRDYSGLAQGQYANAIGTLDQRYGQAADVGREAAGAWQPLIDKNMAGFDVLSNALGINGPAGNEAARNAFQAGPGYQWQVDQATDAAARSGNARGMGYSGNTTDAITRLGSNLANQEWQQWIGNLQPYQTGAHNAVAGQSDALQQLADTYGQWGTGVSGVQQHAGDQLYNTGTDLAKSYTHEGDQRAGAYQNYYENKATIPVAQATATGAANTARMGANAEAFSNFYNTMLGAGKSGFQAGDDAAKNRLGAWMGAADLATKAVSAAWGMPTSFGANGSTQGTAGSDYIKRIFG